MKPTALWVIPVADLGGVARHVLDVARAGLPGWRLVVLCPEGPLAERLQQLGTATITGGFGSTAGFAASYLTLRSAVRTLNPALVHSHLSYADVLAAAVVAGRKQPKLVTTEHGIAADDLVYHGSRLNSRLKAWLHFVRLRRAHAIIAVSEATKSAMFRKWRPSCHINVIPNGVDRQDPVARAHPRNGSSAADGPSILSLSRLAPEKRLPELVLAFAELRRECPAATLTIAGTGPLLGDLDELRERLGLGSSVRLPGFVEPGQAMAAADVLVQLSVWENCSYTLLDAVTAGLGVVATRVGGNVEILPNACLVDSVEPSTVAHAILSQARFVDQRPELPQEWPNVHAMVRRIVQVYGEVKSP